MEKNKSLYPIDISVFRTKAVASSPDKVSESVDLPDYPPDHVIRAGAVQAGKFWFVLHL
ncbi:MAG: hypothetical protein IIA61_13480 [Candidatus Marinimicrobia bacterium]|nr:hypothetical protein [Candidatus Neomarinimicrobiota bacterium]